MEMVPNLVNLAMETIRKNCLEPKMIEDGFLSKHRVVDIECGDVSSYALTSKGLLFGWGYNMRGQVSSGGTSHVLSPFLMSEDVSELFPMSSSSTHIFFRKNGGEIGFCGSNEWGQLGTGSTLDVIDIQTKKEIGGLKTSEIKIIVSNWFVFFLLTTKGEVFSTGTEGYSGHSENKLQFTQLRFPEEKEILNISCSLYYTVFLTSQGHIYYCVE